MPEFAGTSPEGVGDETWFTPGVRGIGAASLLSDLGHEIPTSLLPSLLTTTLGAPASALGLIEGISDGAPGIARFAGGALADDPRRRQRTAVGGYASTADPDPGPTSPARTLRRYYVPSHRTGKALRTKSFG